MKVVHAGYWFERIVAIVNVDCIPSRLDSIRRELAWYQCFRDHPNIVTLYGIVSHSKWVMEYCEWELSNSSWADFNQRLGWALDICNGLDRLHAFNLSHGDLKPDNILIAKETNGAKIAKLIDFGSALRIQASTISDRLTEGTNPFMAPELMDHPEKKCDLAACDIDLAACDIYSLGRVILFMFSTTCFKTDRDERTRIDEYFKEEKFPEFAKPIQEIVHRCCELDPKKRCSLKEVAVCLKELLSGAGVTSLLNKSSRSRAGVTSLLNKGSRSRAGVTSLLNKLGRLESKAIAVKADAVKEVAVKVTNLQEVRIVFKAIAKHRQQLLSRYSKYAT